jgi:hypothetical protein
VVLLTFVPLPLWLNHQCEIQHRLILQYESRYLSPIVLSHQHCCTSHHTTLALVRSNDLHQAVKYVPSQVNVMLLFATQWANSVARFMTCPPLPTSRVVAHCKVRASYLPLSAPATSTAVVSHLHRREIRIRVGRTHLLLTTMSTTTMKDHLLLVSFSSFSLWCAVVACVANPIEINTNVIITLLHHTNTHLLPRHMS